MSRSALILSLLAVLGTLEGHALAADATPPIRISEFMAVNRDSWRDADGDAPDWIELENPGAMSADLGGWFLTDDPNRPTQWTFPATTLGPNSFLLVFASGKDRRIPGGELHTSFSLGGQGEYLALSDPQTNRIAEFNPAYPPQVADVSFGASQAANLVTLVAAGSVLRLQVPIGNGDGTNWVRPEFDDTGWRRGTNAVGYETSPENYASLIRTDVGPAMFGRNASCYLRIPFVVTNRAELLAWRLWMQYDDGFVAWLNGEEIIRENAPALAAWNASALGQHVDDQALIAVEYNLAEFQHRIVQGTNWLAIHALNVGPSSSDLLVLPVLQAASRVPVATGWRYFVTPTPGRANAAGVDAPGPVLRRLAHAPHEPRPDDRVVVTVQVEPAFAAVAQVTLRTRVMFDGETARPMADDGAHGDGVAGDGLYGAFLDPPLAQPGQMVRYFVSATDAAGHQARWPLFLDRNVAPEYQGFVVADASLTNGLPVVHWFVRDPAAAETPTGTRATLGWRGMLHDNVFVRIRGGTSRGWPKHSYKVEFNEGDHLLVEAGRSRVSEINLNTTYTDKSSMRSILTSEFQRDAGLPTPEVFAVHLRQNARFFSVAHWTEQVDTDFLRRHGLDAQGALYKGDPGSTLETSGSFDKKTREQEGRMDLEALLAGLRLGGAPLERFVFDAVDVPAQVNYMATVAITQNIDASDKNYFLYRDTRGSGEWRMIPYDLDLTFGPNALNTDVIVYRENYTSHPFLGARPYLLHGGKYNRLLEALVSVPRTRQMLLRRIRTLADRFLSSNYFDLRLETLAAEMSADVQADRARWGANAHFPGALPTFAQAVARLRTEYLRPRPGYLVSAGIVGVGAANPSAQPVGVTLALGEVDANPADGNQAAEYVEARNPNSFAVDVSGWRLSGGLEHVFRPGTVLPAGGSLYVTRDAGAFRARTQGPRGGQSLFVQGGAGGALSARGGWLELHDDAGRLAASGSYQGEPSAAQAWLRLTEIMYHPVPWPGDLMPVEDYEFVALRNLGTEALDLRGVRLTGGLDFAFASGSVTSLAPGQTVFVVGNRAAFVARYGSGFAIAGEFVGNLSNDGERLTLLDASDEIILDFRYADSWESATDGDGFSLVVSDPNAPPAAWDTAAGWQRSVLRHGTPAAADDDGDGQSNVDEAAAGTNPNDPASLLEFAPPRAEADGVSLEFAAAPGRAYRVEANEGLAADGWVTLAVIPARPIARTERVRDDQPAARVRFYRVVLP